MIPESLGTRNVYIGRCYVDAWIQIPACIYIYVHSRVKLKDLTSGVPGVLLFTSETRWTMFLLKDRKISMGSREGFLFGTDPPNFETRCNFNFHTLTSVIT